MRRSLAVGAAVVAASASCGSGSSRSTGQGARETTDGAVVASEEGGVAPGADDDGPQGPTDATAPGEAGLVGTPDAARSDAGVPDGSGFTPHYVVIEPAGIDPDAYGAGSTPAAFVTSPYTLVVTQ